MSRLRPRFTTKLLLVLMVLFGAILVPFVWRLEKARKQRRAVADVRKVGGEVTYSYDGMSYQMVRQLDWPTDILGLDFWCDVRAVQLWSWSGGSPFEPDVLADLPQLDYINVADSEIELKCLAGVTKLRTLVLANARLKDLPCLSELTSLKALDLSNVSLALNGQIEPLRSLAELESLTQLEELLLCDTAVDDLTPLHRLTNLSIVHLDKLPNGPSQDQRELLKKANPNVKILEY